MPDAKVIVIVGRKRSGKTTEAMRIVRRIGVRPLVYDLYKQWGAVGPLPTMSDFLAKVRALRNGVAVFEDATIFFGFCKQDDLLATLVGARHEGVTTLLVFHSLRSVPLWVFDQTDWIILFKTNDTTATVRRKFGDMERIVDAWEDVNASADPHAHACVEV